MNVRTVRLLEPVVVGLCQYEVAAILSRRKIPTLTRISRQHKWLAPVLLAGLAVHFYLDCWRLAEVAEVIEAALEDDPLAEIA